MTEATKTDVLRFSAPTIITIFGATGDLATKKLLPSLYSLYKKELLPQKTRIIAFSRRDYSDDDYRKFAREAIGDEHCGDFLELLSYSKGNFNNLNDYSALADDLRSIDDEFGVCTNKIYYLATPPSFYGEIFEYIEKSELDDLCSGFDAWTRIVVEKPFGSDLKTAQKLDEQLMNLFDEEEVYRIDHYLAKDTIQNIVTFRFSNRLFEDTWNNEHIERVHIKFFEDFGIENRGSFYDGIGALRDVGQNHMLQTLSLIAMENPGMLEAKALRESRMNVFRALRIYGATDVGKHVVRGQYEGYREVENVAPDSNTETYFCVEAFVDNKRWKGVSFYLESGKGMSERRVEIDVHFKPVKPCAPSHSGIQETKNKLTIRIHPKEGIIINFWVKKPGVIFDLEERKLEFFYTRGEETLPNAYEKVLYDAIGGDQTLFPSGPEVQAAWKFITPIIENWEVLPLHTYKQGTNPDPAKLFPWD